MQGQLLLGVQVQRGLQPVLKGNMTPSTSSAGYPIIIAVFPGDATTIQSLCPFQFLQNLLATFQGYSGD